MTVSTTLHLDKINKTTFWKHAFHLPIFSDLLLHSYEADFLQGRLKNNDIKLSQTCNSSFRYLDDVLSLKNSRFGDYLHRIYPNDLEVKDTTDMNRKQNSTTNALTSLFQ